MGADRLERLLQLFTELYRILTLIRSEDGQVMQFREAITDQITNLFPLELKLSLF